MFVDKAQIYVKAGNGGNGSVAFRREIYVPAGGPSGGDGGNGGSIRFLADVNLRTLMDFKYKRKYQAEPGGDGKTSNMHGKNGEDLILKVPVGTVIIDKKTGKIVADLKNNGDEATVVRGGRGGRGNAFFKNSIRQAPAFAKAGKEGQEMDLVLELKLIADVGLIGFPNAGKSTFLSRATKASPKIANYHFTTLTPNLGVAYAEGERAFVIADIPGLIEGAGEGAGLGFEFLRHIERTRLLIHIIDASGMEGRDPISDFETINKELEIFNPSLAKRPQIVVANKMDLIFDQSELESILQNIRSKGFEVFAVSGATGEGVSQVIGRVADCLENIEEIELYNEEEMLQDESVIPVKNEIEIKKEGETYIVEGKSLERLLYSVNFEDMESIRFFQRIMEENGVFKRLREMGVQDGDTVKIYDLEFEFYD